MDDLLSHFIPAADVEYLLRLPPGAIYNDPTYLELLKQVRYQLLPAATCGNQALSRWIFNLLDQPDLSRRLIRWHDSTSSQVMVESLPRLLTLLDAMPSCQRDWQRALILLMLPLLAHKRPPVYS